MLSPDDSQPDSSSNSVGQRQPFKRLRLGVVALLATATALGLIATAGGFLTATALVGTGVGSIVGYSLLAGSTPVRLLALARPVLRYTERLLAHQVTLGQIATLQQTLFRRLAAYPFAAGSTSRPGLDWERLHGDVERLGSSWVRINLPILLTSLTGGVLVGLAARIDGIFAVVLVAGVAGQLVWTALEYWVARRGVQQTERARVRLRSHWVDFLRGFRDLHWLGRQHDHERELQTRLSRWHETNQQLTDRQSWLSGGRMVLTGGLALAVFYRLLYLHQTGVVSGPVAVAWLLTIMALGELFTTLNRTGQQATERSGAARRLTLRSTTSLVDSPTVPAWSINKVDRWILSNVHLTYAGRPPVFSNVNGVFVAGQWTMLTGPNGAGKSTLLRLMAGLLNPDSGHVYVNGVDAPNLPKGWLLSQVSLLGQQTVLFDTTLAENVRIGRPDATDEQVLDALEKAQLSMFVRGLPAGIHTLVHEAGRTVSGGEARRIALARLFLRDTPVMLLDEPTAGLDAETERAVLRSLREHWYHKTVLFVTHHITPSIHFDRHYRLENGCLTVAI